MDHALVDHGLAVAQLVEGNPVATIVINAEHRVTHWNRACAVLTGVAAEQMIGTNEQWRAFYAGPRPILADLIVDGTLEAGIARFYAGKYQPSRLIDGAYEAEDFFPAFGQGGRWLFFTAAPIRDAQGRIVGAIETLQDVTERRRAEAALRESEAYLAQIVDGSSVATLVIDHQHRVTHWNRACEVLTGALARDMIGSSHQWQPFYAKPRAIMADLVLDNADEATVDRLYHGRFRPSALVEGGIEAEDFFPHFGEGGRWLFFTAAPIRDSQGQVVGAIETLQDVTERRVAEEALRQSEERYRQLSRTDSLTGLFNSRALQQSLQSEVERAERYRRPLSLMVIDCDNFKRINDTYGHLEGDKVLQLLADVMRQMLRRTDIGCRYGGEEFVVLLPESGEVAAGQLADRVRMGFAEQRITTAHGDPVGCTISVGVAEWQPGEDEAALLRRADAAVYAAKHRGKNVVVLASELSSA